MKYCTEYTLPMARPMTASKRFWLAVVLAAGAFLTARVARAAGESATFDQAEGPPVTSTAPQRDEERPRTEKLAYTLTASTLVMQAVTIALQAAEYKAASSTCYAAWALNPSPELDTTFKCTLESKPLTGLRVASAATTWASVGLATGTGVVFAQRDLANARGGLARRQRQTAIAGGVLLALGTVSYALSRLVLIDHASACRTELCFSQQSAADIITRDLSSVMLGASAGLLGYSLTLHRNRKRFSKQIARLEIQPELEVSAYGAAAGVSGHF